MNSKKAFSLSLILIYCAGLCYQFGLILGLYISLLAGSFFLLLTPLGAYISMIVALFSRGSALLVLQQWMLGLWVMLLALNIATLIFFPVIYTKTAITTFVYHMFLVPMAGVVPIAVTGFSAVYYWLVAQYTTSWKRVLLCVLGATGSSIAFHFFMKGFYFAQFIASLNYTTINY